MHRDRSITPSDLLPRIDRLFEISAAKIRSLEASWRPEDGAPVFTVNGRWQSRGWTEWTQGFQFGSSVLQFDATADREFLRLARDHTVERMAPHLTHTGVHDHGFNNVSTYGGLWRLAREGRFDASEWEVRFYELALKVSGAVQAARWTRLANGGFIHSFNGAHSLFVDTIRSLRALALAHLLGHRLVQEQDTSVSLLERMIQHARATAEYSIYYGNGRDT
jgi:unsaturated chondroitin disaccharide hydrolase